MSKTIFKVAILVLLSFTVVYAKWYITPKRGDVATFSTSTARNRLSKVLEFETIYLASELKNGRYRVKELNVWVDSAEVLVNLNPRLLRHQLFYLERHENAQQRNRRRVETEVRNNPQWDQETRDAVLNFQILPNWPESLVVASWGKPDSILREKKDGKNITKIKYGNRYVILEENQVRELRTEPAERLDIRLER